MPFERLTETLANELQIAQTRTVANVVIDRSKRPDCFGPATRLVSSDFLAAYSGQDEGAKYGFDFVPR